MHSDFASADVVASPAPTLNRGKIAAARRTDILDGALREFATHGLSGARMDRIAIMTGVNKATIYCHFRSKVELYRAVLERCYKLVRQIDLARGVDELAPAEALRAMVRKTFDYHVAHPEFVRLVMSENINQGTNIGHSQAIRSMSNDVVQRLRVLLARGVSACVFRPGIDPVELHMTVSALSFYFVSNQYTFGRIFDRDMQSPEAREQRREEVVAIVEKWCAAVR